MNQIAHLRPLPQVTICEISRLSQNSLLNSRTAFIPKLLSLSLIDQSRHSKWKGPRWAGEGAKWGGGVEMSIYKVHEMVTNYQFLLRKCYWFSRKRESNLRHIG